MYQNAQQIQKHKNKKNKTLLQVITFNHLT